jgi:hypothetical protein
MARIADKHGLTNKYRPVGSGKRVVKRGRPRKYLFGPPSKKRKSYKCTGYRRSTTRYNPNTNVDVNTKELAFIGSIVVLIIFLIIFSAIRIFRCLIPLIIGGTLLFVVNNACRKAWGLPHSKNGTPVSWGWTILTAFAMIVGFILVLIIQVANTSASSLFVFIALYFMFSILILKRKRKKIEAKNCSDYAKSFDDK